MGFQFRHRRNIEKQVQAIAREQIDKALDACRHGDAAFGDVVHTLRRRCKKLRGLVKLIEPHFKHHKLENRTFRDAAGVLSGTRDAAVLLDTFTDLLRVDRDQDGGPRIDAGQGELLRHWLAGRIAPPPEGPDRAHALGTFVNLFQSAQLRVEGWSLSGRDFDTIGDGLEDTYRRMREGMAVANAKQTAEALHGWRKDIKYHWHHVSLLRLAAPEILQPRRASLDRLGKMLGDHHNLAILDQAIAPRADVAAIRSVIAERQGKLASAALQLGRQLVAEKPAMLRDRFERYWSLLPEKT